MHILKSIITALLLFTLTITLGQTISNSGFENWSTAQYFEEPVGYNTTNVVTFFGAGAGEVNVVKTSDAYSGSYAITLETIDSPEGPISGAAFIGSIGTSSIIGGIPYNQRPDALTGYVKYNTNATDTAYIAAIFKKFGAPLGICWAKFNGTQNSFQSFTQPVEWILPIISPDTVAIVLISSSIFSSPVVGNMLTADQLEFVGASIPFPEGDFENWTSFESEETDDWLTSNIMTLPESGSSVTKSTDSYEGNFAARIENMPTFAGDTMGFISNGTLSEEGLVGGMPVSLIPDKLSGYYKYSPVGPDTALAALMLYKYNESTGTSNLINETFLQLPAVNDYTYFELEVDYYALPEPDTVNIAFASGNLDDNNSFVGLGSVLFIDDLDITYKPHIVNVDDVAAGNSPIVYPNPASNNLFIEIKELLNQTGKLTVFNSSGKLIFQDKFNRDGINSIEVESYLPGVYFYHIEIGSKIYNGKFIVE